MTKHTIKFTKSDGQVIEREFGGFFYPHFIISPLNNT